MRFLFIRHGEPNYIKDCLTPTGRLQAEAAAKRLPGEYVHPRVELFNDAAHIKGLGDELKIQQKSN